MANRYNVIGVNDERDFCECCGKQGLKRVVWIEDTETQEIKHFGTSCAASPVKGFGVDKEIKSAIAKHQGQQKAIYRYAYSLYRKAGGTLTGNPNDGWKYDDVALRDECQAKAAAYYKTAR